MESDPIDKLTNLPPEVRERIKARRAQTQAEIAKLNEQVASMFQLADSVHAAYRTPDGRIDPNSDIITFGKFQNQKGDVVYTRRGSKESYPSQDQLTALSGRIKTEEADFRTLDPSEQTRIRREGNPKFEAYLANEVLREQFQKLK